MKRQVLELTDKMNTALNGNTAGEPYCGIETRTKELQMQATISNLGLQINQLKQEKIGAELTLEEQRKANEDLKRQIEAIAAARPSIYLDAEHDEPFGKPESTEEELRKEIEAKDIQIAELQAKL